MKQLLHLFLALLLSTGLFAQTGLIDDFEDGVTTGWAGGNFTLSESGGEMLIQGSRSSTWDAIDYNFSDVDMSTDPYLSLEVRSNFNLAIAIALGINYIDGNGDPAYAVFYPARIQDVLPYAWAAEQEIVESDTYQQYSFDYTGISFDLPDGAVHNGITGPATLTDVQILGAISNIHILPNPVGLYPAPNVTDPSVYIDNLSIGDEAAQTPSLSKTPDQAWTVVASGTVAKTVALRNITDGYDDTQTITITAASSNTALIPDPIVVYTSPDRYGELVLTPNDDVVGESTISVTVSSPGTADDKVMTFKVNVYPNNAPTLTALEDMLVVAGETITLHLDNINDGNSEIEQTLTVTSSSSNTGLIPDPTVSFDQVYHEGSIEFTPDAGATPGSTVDITVTIVDDGGVLHSGSNSQDFTFTATIYDEVNNAPTFDDIPDIGTPGSVGTHSFTLTGVSDGDDDSQTLTWTVSSSNTAVATNLSVGAIVDGEAVLSYDLTGTLGTSNITLRATDDGGNAGNNGNQYLEQVFEIEALTVPITGLVIDFEAGGTPADYGFSSEAGYTLSIESGELHIACDYTAYSFPGMWWSVIANTGGQELDMSAAPYINVKFRNSTSNNNGLDDETRFLMFLWDQDSDGAYGNTSQELFIPEDGLQKDLFINFSGSFYEDEDGQVDSSRINSMLFNLDNRWFYDVTGDYWIDEIRMGDSAILVNPPVNTIDNVPDQIVDQGTTPDHVILTGISDGDGNATTDLTYHNSNTSVVTSITIGTVSNGTAELTYTIGAGTGSSDIMVIANNAGMAEDIPDTAFFTISVFDESSVTSTVTLDPTTEYQEYRGVGGVSPPKMSASLVPVFNDLNWTMTRIFGDFDQIEPVNDNGDPDVLARENLVIPESQIEIIRTINEQTNCHTFFYSPLSQPTWMKTNKSRYPAEMWAGNNHIDPSYYKEFGEYLVAVTKMIKEKAGVELYAISIQNEPQFNEPYSSTQVMASEFVEILKVVGPMLEDAGLNTKVLMSEDVHSFGWVTDRINAVNADADARDYLNVIGFHCYAADGIENGFSDAATYESLYSLFQSTPATDLWMTESSGWVDDWDGKWGTAWNGNPQFLQGSFGVAGGYYMLFKHGKINGWTDLNEPDFMVPQPHVSAVTKHFTNFTNPGDVCIDATSDDSEVLSLAFKNTTTDALAITLINTAYEPKVVQLAGTSIPTLYRHISSQEFDTWVENVPVVDQLTMKPRSVVTLYSDVSNIAPTINNVSNQTYLLSDGVQTVNLSGISDGNPDQVQVITVDAVSSTPGVATVSTTYASDDATGSLTITPVAYGQTTITVTVQDDGGTANSGVDTKVITFTVDVMSEPNLEPTIDAVSDITLLESAAAYTIDLSGITDGDDDTQNLTVTAVSSNTELFSGVTVNYTGNNTTGSLEVQPTAELSGTTTISVSVADDGGNASNNGDQTTLMEFNITVDPVNDVPTIGNMNDLTIYTYLSSLPFNFNGVDDGDIDSDQTITVTATSSNPTLISPDITYTSGDATGTLTLNLLQEVNGTATITLTVQDDGGTTNGGLDQVSITFDVTLDFGSGVNEQNADVVKLYPIPAANILSVTTSSNAMISSFNILDLSGKVVKSNSINPDKIVNIPVYDLNNGTYILELYSDKGKMLKTFIKQ